MLDSCLHANSYGAALRSNQWYNNYGGQCPDKLPLAGCSLCRVLRLGPFEPFFLQEAHINAVLPSTVEEIGLAFPALFDEPTVDRHVYKNTCTLNRRYTDTF